jgi:melibiose permease/lactose/raffinose/galactose permease
MKKQGGKLFGTYSGNKVPRLTESIYSFSGIFRDACTVLVSGFFLTFAKTAGLLDSGSAYIQQLSVISTILALLLIWDGFNDPIMAIIIEKCHFKTGKYRPWILLGAIGNSLMVLLMFLTKPKGWLFVTMFGLYYFLWDFAFTMNDIAYWSMLPSLTNEGKERNNLTTLVTISATLGNIAMNVIVVLCQGDGSHNYDIFGKIAIPTASLFLLSQIAVFFFCKEHVRDPKQEQVSSRTKFTDLFSIMRRNKPLRMSIFSIFFYYLLSAVLMGFGFDYFYFTYSSIDLGGDMAVYFLVTYVTGCLLAQAFYPALARRFSKKVLLALAFYLSLFAFALFFFLGLPLFGENPIAYSAPISFNGKTLINPFIGTGWIIFIPVFLFSMAIGIYYLVQLVLFQDSIDYNEWRFGERKEALACAWRPISSKVSSALEKGLYNIAIISTGLDATFNLISEANQEVGANLTTSQEASSVISNALSGVSSFTKISFTIWMGVSIFVCLIASYLCLRIGYKISEKDHQQIVVDLERRQQQNLQSQEVKVDSSIPR